MIRDTYGFVKLKQLSVISTLRFQFSVKRTLVTVIQFVTVTGD